MTSLEKWITILWLLMLTLCAGGVNYKINELYARLQLPVGMMK
jgi:hypothetical protein